MFKIDNNELAMVESFVESEYVESSDCYYSMGGCMTCSNSCAENCANKCKASKEKK
ncbi:MAG: hypothetical protein Q4F15_04930 [Bacillota bacterium]|nr:hypothetical protein [Bacillota bacterium]